MAIELVVLNYSIYIGVILAFSILLISYYFSLYDC